MARWLFLCACLFGLVAAYGFRDASRAPDARTLGGVCESTYECRSNLRCVDVEGVMQGQCSTGCNSNTACTHVFGPNSLCLGADMCARTCRSLSDCPSGTDCNSYGWCERIVSE